MDDEFGGDDFELDDVLLEALKDTEERYNREIEGKRSLPADAIHPPQKKSKFEITNPDLDFDDLPDILVNKDGTYSFASAFSGSQTAQRSFPNGPDATNITVPTSLKLQPSPENFLDESLTGTQRHTAVQKELIEEISKLKDQLKLAEALRTEKDGEISNLRRNLDQTSADYRLEISRLKTQKEEIEQLKDKLHNELQEEIARMKNRLSFKQGELDVTNRSIALALSSHTRGRFAQITPAKHGFQSWPSASESNLFSLKASTSPRKTPTKYSKAVFPSFHNTFLGSSPTRSKAPMDLDAGAQIIINSSPALPEPQDTSLSYAADSMNVERLSLPEIDHNTPMEELQNILFSDLSTNNQLLALQHVLTWSGNDSDVKQKFEELSRNLLVAVSIKSVDDTETVWRTITICLCGIGVLVSSDHVGKLSAVLTILNRLIARVPPARNHLFGIDPVDDHSLTRATEFFRICIAKLSPLPMNDDAFMHPGSGLVVCLVNILESYATFMPDASGFSEVLCHPCFVRIVIDKSCPQWLYIRVVKFLTSVASRHPSLSVAVRSILFRRQDGSGSAIERFCAFLARPLLIVDLDEVLRKRAIMALFISLSFLPQSALLAEEPAFIPCLVISLYYLTALIWEEDEWYFSGDSCHNIACLIHNGVLLLHSLVFSTNRHGVLLSSDGPMLTRALFEARNTTVLQTGDLGHMFVLAFGRLSYGFSPKWVNENCRTIIEGLCDLAHDLIQSVIEGPEEDMIWSAYNEADDQTTDEDEEILARSMEID